MRGSDEEEELPVSRGSVNIEPRVVVPVGRCIRLGGNAGLMGCKKYPL